MIIFLKLCRQLMAFFIRTRNEALTFRTALANKTFALSAPQTSPSTGDRQAARVTRSSVKLVALKNAGRYARGIGTVGSKFGCLTTIAPSNGTASSSLKMTFTLPPTHSALERHPAVAVFLAQSPHSMASKSPMAGQPDYKSDMGGCVPMSTRLAPMTHTQNKAQEKTSVKVDY